MSLHSNTTENFDPLPVSISGNVPATTNVACQAILFQQQHLFHLKQALVRITDAYSVNAIETDSRSNTSMPHNFVDACLAFSVLQHSYFLADGICDNNPYAAAA